MIFFITLWLLLLTVMCCSASANKHYVVLFDMRLRFMAGIVSNLVGHQAWQQQEKPFSSSIGQEWILQSFHVSTNWHTIIEASQNVFRITVYRPELSKMHVLIRPSKHDT